MTKFAKSAVATTCALAALFGLAMALPQAAGAQQAGGSEAGVGAPVVNNALWNASIPPTEPLQCIHRVTDDRPSSNPDDKRLTVWLSVRHLTTAKISASGSASGSSLGSLSITIMRDGIQVAQSQESRGTKSILAHTAVGVPLIPGRQYQFTAKPTVRYKTLGLFRMDVAVGGTCL